MRELKKPGGECRAEIAQEPSLKEERMRSGAGGGKYYRIEVRKKSRFSSFRTHDVGKKGGVLRIAGRRRNGLWDTQSWLLSKNYAHKVRGGLIPDRREAKDVLKTLGSIPKHLKGDMFIAKPRKDIAESRKPAPAQRNAYMRNIRKAQKARRK